MEALHQPVGVRAEDERLTWVPEGADPLCDEFRSLLPQYPTGPVPKPSRVEKRSTMKSATGTCLALASKIVAMLRKMLGQTQSHRTRNARAAG
jgi:hypothetical protein